MPKPFDWPEGMENILDGILVDEPEDDLKKTRDWLKQKYPGLFPEWPQKEYEKSN